ncbi:DUF4279 domain-containing protein [Myxococcota bacterium]|nr:DUF4279 domain-containing protein [Myxococcota bacterium]
MSYPPVDVSLTSDAERVNVELRVYCGDIDPSDVTARLEVPPTLTIRRGETMTNSIGITRTHKLNGWFLASEGMVTSTRLEDHLVWFVAVLTPAAPALTALLVCPGVSAVVVCTRWSAVSGTSLPITVPTLRLLAELGIDLHVNFACYEEGDAR